MLLRANAQKYRAKRGYDQNLTCLCFELRRAIFDFSKVWGFLFLNTAYFQEYLKNGFRALADQAMAE